MEGPRKIIVNASDVAMMFGVNKRTGQYHLKQVRDYLIKAARQPVTVSEFCYFFGLRKSEVYRFLRGEGIKKGTAKE
jgi:hypothetical protein